jgi:beta-glucuronidase
MRIFPEHELRKTQSLDGLWDFHFLGDVDADTLDVNDIDYTERMAVPGCFDATPAYAGKRGLAAYHRAVYIASAGRQRLAFNSVNHWCRIFINGEQLQDHIGGFGPFTADFELEEDGWVDLTVLVDNRLNYQRCPLHLDYMDWYHYGGISRSVVLHSLGKAWIERVQIKTTGLEPPEIGVEVLLQSTGEITADCVLLINDEAVMDQPITVNDGAGFSLNIELEGAHLWSPDHPHLHTLRVIFGEDDQAERFGIRTITTNGQELLLNGKPLRLLGFNRHEIHPDFGHALPDTILLTDLQYLKDMHCNFIRGSHYPQDPRFLDLCDEMGFLVWNESIGWQHTAEHLNDPFFMECQVTNLHEMVHSAINHPSVILWGILNESRSDDPACRAAYQALISEIRSLDDSRPVTYATCYPFEDLNFDLVDVISINRYPGWYEGQLEDIPAVLDRLAAHVDSLWADKPLIISEIGAGAVPGWRDRNEDRWSEQYQRKLYEIVIDHLFEQRSRVCGLALWVFADFRSIETTSRLLGRPRGYNNKGCLDEYRRPKNSHPLVKEKFSKLAR